MKVLLADDHALFRSGLSYVLSELDDDLDILEAEDLPQALEIARGSSGLDLAIVDLKMPGMSGVSGIEEMKSIIPDTPIVVISAYEDRDHILQAIDAGAAGYIPKSLSGDVLIGAIKLIFSGGVYLPKAILSQPGGIFMGEGDPPSTKSRGGLTKRQFDVLQQMRKGASNKEIARELSLSEGTVKLHVTAILKTLDVDNRTQAVVKASQLNLTPPVENGV